MQEEIEQLACEGALCRRVNGDYGGEMLEEIEQRCLWQNTVKSDIIKVSNQYMGDCE